MTTARATPDLVPLKLAGYVVEGLATGDGKLMSDGVEQ